jgi:uncharacterized spore protein YtfJ
MDLADFTERFAANIGSWGAGLAYGAPTVVGNVEVLPVALVAFGFGAGELDRAASSGPSGEGGGGSGLSVPLGVYVGDGKAARFVPNTPTLALAVASVIAAVGVAVSTVIFAAGRR